MQRLSLYTILALLSLAAGGAATAQSFYDINTIQSIAITFTQPNWDYLLDTSKAGSDGYIMAQSVTINGTRFDSVGVKFKGNSTYNANSPKNPFHIELDTYKEQDYQGYTDIKLSNAAKDPSFLREVLSYSILRKYMDASLSNYATVSVNGSPLGLYVSSESVGKKFVNSRFNSKENAFFKCNPIDGAGPGTSALPNLVYLGPDSASYAKAYEMQSDAGWIDLIGLCSTLKNNVAGIETVLDVDRALWMLAFDNLLVNLDSYIGGFAQNYYLYKDNTGRFNCVLWDFNESFGTFSQTGTGNLTSTTSSAAAAVRAPVQENVHRAHADDARRKFYEQQLSRRGAVHPARHHCRRAGRSVQAVHVRSVSEQPDDGCHVGRGTRRNLGPGHHEPDERTCGVPVGPRGFRGGTADNHECRNERTGSGREQHDVRHRHSHERVRRVRWIQVCAVGEVH